MARRQPISQPREVVNCNASNMSYDGQIVNSLLSNRIGDAVVQIFLGLENW